MILTEQHHQAINYILEGFTITEIAKLCNCSRASIYNWLDDGDFKSELDKREQELSKAGRKAMTAEVNKYINKLKLLATSAKSEKVQLDAVQYLLNRIYGTPTTKVEDVTENKTQAIDKVDLEQEIDSFKVIELKEKAE